MRISDWSSDVCSSDLGVVIAPGDNGIWLATLREGSDPAVLIEVKRYLAQPLRVATAGAADFDRLMSDHYAVDSSAAAMAGSLDGSDIDLDIPSARSEERRVGKDGVRTCRSRWGPAP